MTDWGLVNAHLEPWDFGHPGWLNERFSGFLVSPVRDTLVGEVLAWTPGTNGTVTAKAVRIEPPQCAASAPRGGNPFAASPAGPPSAPPAPPKCPTQEELTKYFDSVRASLTAHCLPPTT